MSFQALLSVGAQTALLHLAISGALWYGFGITTPFSGYLNP